MTGFFSQDALEAAWGLLYAEGQKNPLEGECGQKAKRERSQKPRTPEQQRADKARSQALQGKTRGGTNRSAAAKKAAETRSKCKQSTTHRAPFAPTSTT